MSHVQNFDKSALLALPNVQAGSTPEKGLLSWSRPYLIDQVRSHGVDVLVTRGATSLDAENGVAKNVVRPEYSDGEVTMHQLGDTALQSFDVMRTIIKTVDVDHLVPALNPTALRVHSRNKHLAIADVLRPAGAYDRGTILVNPGDDVSELIGHLPGDLIVAKPDFGRKSNGVKIGDKHTVAEFVSNQEVPYLVEEKLDFSAPIPMIRGVDEEQQARLDEANRLGVNKELRVYFFGKDTWDSVMRVAKPGETDFRSDDWLFIDHDSIPDDVYLLSAKAIEKMKEKFDTDEANIALDFAFSSTASQPEPHWEIMEMNVAEPQLIREHENMTISRRQHAKLATQIARIAVS